jgi:sigma-B regulation protein RsbU (phosphoserine phosphatase)
LFQVSRWGAHALGLYILDASGHGVAAALRAAQLMSFLHEDHLAKLTESYDPGAILTAANRQFPLTADGEYFTLWIGRIDFATWGLSFATAGHCGALLQRDAGVQWLTTQTFPLGFESETTFSSQHLALYPGDRVFLLSDGIYEAPSPDGEMWGCPRLADQLIASRRQTVAESVSQTVEMARQWHGRETFPDDVALLGLELGIPPIFIQE